MPDMKDNQVRTSPARGHLSSALSAVASTVHTQFLTWLEMKRLKNQCDKNHLIASVIDSQAQIAKKKTSLEAAENYDGPAEIVKAKRAVELADLETEKQVYKAQKGRDQAKQELEKENNADYRERKEQERLLLIEESIAKISASIRTHELIGKDSQVSPAAAEPSAEDRRNEAKKQMDERAKTIDMIDTWRREELLKLDDQERQELAELEAASWTPEEKKKKKYEIEARLARRKEEILTTAPNMEKSHG